MFWLKCADCGATNGLDGVFCRQCGKPVPVDQLARAKQEMLELVADGNQLLSQGRVNEALSIASASLEASPDCVAALALYAEALFKLGRVDEAVQTYAGVVALRPDNTADQLRMAEMKAKRKPARRGIELNRPTQILLTALGLTLILGTVGTALILASNQPKPAAQVAELSQPATQGDAFSTIAPVPAAPVTYPTGQPESAMPAATEPPATQIQIPSVKVDGPAARNGTAKYSEPSQPVPPVAGDPNQSAMPIIPASDPLPYAEQAPPQNPDPQAAPAPAPQKPPPVIEFRKREPQPEKPSATAPSSPQLVDVLIRVARERYAQADYEKAASAYEKAIRAGASKGSSNQRLAQCYERLGKSAEALAAYKRALAAYEAQQARQPEPRIERAIAACRKAIELLTDNHA